MRLLLVGSIVCASILYSLPGHAACSPSVAKPSGLYLDHGNGTVTDNKTGLMWQKCSQGLSDSSCTTGVASAGTWQDALLAAQNANTVTLLGYSDWRLPNAKELASLADKACSAPAANVSIFPATQSASYWTSSPASQAADSAWVVDFSVGSLATETKDTLNYVRLVRSGY